ncbi:MAG: hypothetical protein ACJ8BW_39070 [Ktedonobacteraceae bacterium]|jgi:hypothetical protein
MMPPSSRQATNGWATTYVCPLKLGAEIRAEAYRAYCIFGCYLHPVDGRE